jgi:TonB family protein
LKSALPANCNYQAALALSERSDASGGLEFFKSKRVASIEIQTARNNSNDNSPPIKKSFVRVDFPEISSLKFLHRIKCLSNYFGKEEPKQSTLQYIDSIYQEDGSRIFATLDEQPEYIGGINAMMSHILSNMKYPANARRLGVSGTVRIGFFVGVNGVISNTTVVQSIGKDCDMEAKRIVELMPPWKPARFNGKPVTVRVILPFKFKLN